MNAVVFLGPTVPRAAAKARLDATYLLPARQGDVYRALQTYRPRAIGLIDGVFLDVPAVWHRELLWALSEGVHVFGAASMGALRAAELAPFGMRGVGRIFDAYQAGRWPDEDDAFEDDDEVAVIHAPAEAGGVPLSDAMVDLRASLDAAVDAGVVGRAGRNALLAVMKGLHFPDRSFARMEVEARGVLDDAVAERLCAWLVTGRVAQKRLDGLALLETMAEFLATDPPSFQPSFRFEPALVWEQFVRATTVLTADEELVLEELRLDPRARVVAERAVLGRMMAPVAPADITPALDALRTRLGLLRRSELDDWMRDNALDTAGLERLLHREVAVEAAAREGGAALEAALVEHLRLEGQFAPRLARARAKQQALAGRTVTPPAGPAMAAVLDWYFGARLGEPLPRSMTAWARAQGWPSDQVFTQAVWRDYLFAETQR